MSLTAPGSRWQPVDAIVAAYAGWTGLLILWFADRSGTAMALIGVHVAIIATLSIIPPRGAAWEARRWPAPWQRLLHGAARFLRHAYPLPLALFFFEEGSFTVNMIFPHTPYWFEPALYAADVSIFGDLPARLMASWVTPLTTEIMHFFYASYYPILIGGVAIAYAGPRRGTSAQGPGPAFAEVITALTAAFVFAFALYPWIASRGPWENAALVAELPPFEGFLFTGLIDTIIEHGAVSGNCFPSGHVAGAWAIVFGLAGTRAHRKTAFLFAFLAVGMSLACVYTRYHHAVDIPAGFACGLAGAVWARRVSSRTGPG